MRVLHTNSLQNYPESMEKMQNLIQNKKHTIWFLEYEDVITDGKVGRGGGEIYHGPGQRVIYFIAKLTDLADNIADFIYKLEDTIYNTCLLFNLKAEKRLDGPGVWINGLKVAFIGLRVNKDSWLSHGVAINLNVDLKKFDCVDVCGKACEVGNIEVDMKMFDDKLLQQMQITWPELRFEKEFE